MARQRSSRPDRIERTRILVVTEGLKTEPQYLEGLQSYYRSIGATAVVERHGLGKDPKAVAKHCIDLKKRKPDFDYYVCLVDVDQHPHLDEAMRIAEQNDVLMLVSNVKFEVWLLWHVKESRAAQTSSNLDHAVLKHDLVTGKKKKDISRNFPYQYVENAIRTAYLADLELAANRKGQNPSTAMPVLISLMLKEKNSSNMTTGSRQSRKQK